MVFLDLSLLQENPYNITINATKKRKFKVKNIRKNVKNHPNPNYLLEKLRNEILIQKDILLENINTNNGVLLIKVRSWRTVHRGFISPLLKIFSDFNRLKNDNSDGKSAKMVKINKEIARITMLMVN